MHHPVRDTHLLVLDKFQKLLRWAVTDSSDEHILYARPSDELVHIGN